ncbi:glycosyl transferase family 4 [Candidatus Pacearchaeota archaeon]|nr:glycosyl transferase family 4 [Candidatus Pacearchaeota archaeon]
MENILILSVLASFFVTLFFMPIWIKKAKEVGIVGKDLNKPGEKKDVAEAGGVGVLFGFVFGVLLYIGIKIFYFKGQGETLEIFALLFTVFAVAFIGLIDDILGWKIGLTRKTRLLFVFFAAIPLMVINVGESRMMGIELGIFYPLILVPLGIIATSTTFNFLAGYNGLETSQGIIILLGLSFVTFNTGNSWLSIVCLTMVAALLAFYLFNKYPAKVFPGDILTYSVGALIGAVAIIGNIEKIAIFFFIPYIFEVILKVRGKLKKESFPKVNPDGSLEMPYEKFYGLEHIAIWLLKKVKPSKKVYEYEVVWVINVFQITIIFLGLLIFGSSFL